MVKEHDAEGSVNSVKNGGFMATDTYSVYPNGFFRCSNDGRYTKHIYIGAERIASQVGGKPYPSPNTESVSVAGRSNGIDIRVDYSGKLDQHLAQIDSVYDAFDLPYNGTNHDSYYNNYFFDRPGYWDNTEGMTLNGGEPEMPRSIQDRDLLYYYHRDHLGSSTAVSNDDGKLSQQIEYLPYGEVFLKKQMASSDYHSLYKFNGKELDEETGLYYYGARYMNPRLSIWYGTDPLEELKYNISTYSYCIDNPIFFVDHNGCSESTDVIRNTNGTYTVVKAMNDGDNNIYVVNKNHKRTGEIIGTTLKPYDFMGTNDITGAFISDVKNAGITFDINNLRVSGTIKTDNRTYSIYNADARRLINWGMNVFRTELELESPFSFYGSLDVLRSLSHNTAPLDLKVSLKHNPYTAISVGANRNGSPIITTLRAIGNILFGANMRLSKPYFMPIDFYYKGVMKRVGAYNQTQNSGIGYNKGFPYYGEHTYSGSYIYYGYYEYYELSY